MLIGVYGLTLFVVGLGATRALTHHEVLAAQPAREMLHEGHWIIPTFAGVPRVVKPPTTGWLIAGSMALFGSEAEWVVRLPAVLAAVALALMVAALAARWLGGHVGLLAGLMQATCFYTLIQGRLAEADMPLTAAVCAAMSLFAMANVEHPSGRRQDRWLPWAFFAACGAAFLLKGPVGLLFIFSGCAAFALWNRDRQALRFLLNPVGWGILLACVVGWPVASYLAYPPIVEIWKQELFGYATGKFSRDPFWFYLVMAPAYVLPWTPFVAVAWVRGRREGWTNASLAKFLACWLVPGLLILSCSKSKSAHYAFPLLPPLTLLAAEGLALWLRRQYQSAKPRLLLPAGLLWAGCAAGIVAMRHFAPRLPGSFAMIVVAMGIGGAAIILMEWRRRYVGELIALFATAWVVLAGIDLFVLPFDDGYRYRAEFARRVNQIVPADQTIYLLDAPENQVTWYLRPPVRRVDGAGDLAGRLPLDQGKDVYAVGHAALAGRLEGLGAVRLLERVEQVKGPEREANLILVKLTPGRCGNDGPSPLPPSGGPKSAAAAPQAGFLPPAR